MRAYEAVIAKRSQVDLLGTNFDIENATFIDPIDVAPDEPADSFYEYLWGGWQMLGIAQSRAWYRTLTLRSSSTRWYRVNGQLWFAQVDYRNGARAGDSQITELSAFYAELVAKGGDRAIGEAFYDSWTAVLNRYR